jgi:hypothetical protein
MSIRGGLDFIVHSASSQFDTSIDTPMTALHPPSRAGLFIDLTNAWNRVSRDAAYDENLQHPSLSSLRHYFSLMYGAPNKCFFKLPGGTLGHFLQEDGFPQGDPLSPALSCLVIHRLL